MDITSVDLAELEKTMLAVSVDDSSAPGFRTLDADAVPIRTIDLDEPPNQRWVPLVTEYRDRCLAVIDRVRATVGGSVRLFGLGLAAYRFFGGAVWYDDELASIAAVLGLDVAEVVMLQLVYEASAC
jgi:hypothetical protein